MYKVIYLPTAEEVKLPNDFYSSDKYRLLEFIKANNCYRHPKGFLTFLLYDDWLVGSNNIYGAKVPKHLLEIIEVN